MRYLKLLFLMRSILKWKRSSSELPLGRLNQLHDLGENEFGEPLLVDLVGGGCAYLSPRTGGDWVV